MKIDFRAKQHSALDSIRDLCYNKLSNQDFLNYFDEIRKAVMIYDRIGR